MTTLSKRLARIEEALDPKGVSPEELRFLVGYWKEHFSFPEGARARALDLAKRWVDAISAMHASVPGPPGEEPIDYWERKRRERCDERDRIRTNEEVESR